MRDDDRMGRRAADQLDDAANRVLLSAAVVLEIAIKRSLGKLDAPEETIDLLLQGGASPLPIDLRHARRVETLPWHHRDPFDRLLVAQALVEGAVLVSTDRRLAPYGAPILW